MRTPRLDGLRRLAPEQIVTFGVVTAACLFVFSQLNPGLILSNSTPAGGDMGAHVWAPAYLRDHLLPSLRITGWAPAWYAGFPALWFYFPLPAIVIVLLDVVLPYGVAFKLVTILGLVGLPVSAWAFGRLAGMRFPGPPLLAVFTVPFLFDRFFTIYGGNIASTLAGEFSFAISLCLSLVFLGVVARGLDTGRDRALAAVLLALTGLSHLLPTIFAVVGALLLLVLRPGRRRASFLGGILLVGALLAAFWSVPFLFRMPYANNMGWEKLTEYGKNLFRWEGQYGLRWIVLMALAGAIASVVLRRKVGMWLVGMAIISAAVFVLAPQGRLWNARVLPFWYLCLYLLAAVAVAELAVALARLFADDPDRPPVSVLRGAPVAAAVAVWLVVGLPLGSVPSLPLLPTTSDTSYIPAWARWNYSGYEGKPAYPEYRALIDTMANVGRTHGCGRAHWEYEAELDRFGTPMALMLLPYWTDQCIGSMEGLYFESSATTPYHFLAAGELSKAPSNPQRDLPYGNLVQGGSVQPGAFDLGVAHLKMLGTRYYMAFSPEAVGQADRHPDLRLVATTGRWRIYEVSGSELVTPLAFKPAVLTGIPSRLPGPLDGLVGGPIGERPWLDLAVNWYLDGDAHAVPLAATGPPDWPRVALHSVAGGSKEVGSSVAVDTPPRVPVPDPGIRNIRSTQSSISFDVERPGSPVLVKVSYFPNWKVEGASGVHRVTPNLMVVTPTANRVTLRFGYTPVDALAWALTIAGVVLVVLWWRRGPVDLDGPSEGARQAEAADTERPVRAGAGIRRVRPTEPVTVRDRGP